MNKYSLKKKQKKVDDTKHTRLHIAQQRKRN